jgi:hypothetical protein|tara:strand:- start:224 stop:577 length:354 start_codon:yes stop_codon:yes gene_type:complete
MTKTTLTREQFLQKAKPRFEFVDVEPFGKVGIRSISKVQQTRRQARLHDADGNIVQKNLERFQVHAIIDHLMIDESTPMFKESDAEEIGNLDAGVLEELLQAIEDFNKTEDAGKKGE